MKKNILGLDLGTNSIGWALIRQDFENKQGEILGMGSRIIPMDAGTLGKFAEGSSISQTAERTGYRGVRRLRERHLLRRERLHRVLNILGFLPEHYAQQIDFEKRLGQFKAETESKLAWKKNDNEKFEFLFQQSFAEMVADFKAKGQDTRIPYDWTIYYLRKKALSQKISSQELAWIILNFNQKRGYYQLRGEEEEENPNKKVEFHSLKIVDVVADEQPNKKGETWYSLHLENGWIYRRSSKTPLDDWKEKTRDFIVTTDINEDGSEKLDKEGAVKRSFRAPKEDDWTLVKKKTEQEIDSSNKTVGAYIYENLLNNPTQKIRGKLVRTIERKFYKAELKQILKKQIELQPELFPKELYNDCVSELYRNNEAHQFQLSSRDFLHLFIDDIIFYQRPLRSQKSTISNCSLEYRNTKDKDGNNQIVCLKAIPKSNPYYQEFRVWQWLYNLKIYTKEDDKDVTEQFINKVEDLEALFEFLMNQKEVNHTDILAYFVEPLVKEKYPNAKAKAFKDALKKEIGKYRWNYVYDSEKDESKLYPMNETGFEIRKRLAKVENIPANFLTREIEQHLWHIIYSVTDKIEFEKALKSFANRYNLDEKSFIDNFKRFKPFDSDYGSYSEKAIKKLLPLIRVGKYWNWDAIDDKTKNRIDNIINAVDDEKIRLLVREKAEKLKLEKETDFQGLQLWLAQYIVYDRHSEANIAGKWNSVADLEQYLTDFKQHSLRNPIVEQVVTETLRVVKDIWTKYGKGAKDYFDEIHIELGREMKNTAEERKRLTSVISENETTNLRIKAILQELMNDESVENVRPYSPMQQEALKIYEDGVLNSGITIPDEMEKISKKSEPTKSEIQRYKLWLEQKYQSPYTGRPIPLSKLFTSAYEIEHIIPQSRYFDDSFSNKVICEAEVNSLKDKQLGLEFIKNNFGRRVSTVFGEVEILSETAYIDFVKSHYEKNRSKRNKLLLDEIPEKMIERQLNDTRYISKFISNVLSNIVRSDKDDEGINSKNLIPGNGKITNQLKQDWGLNDVWNDLILPRFERMNELTKSNIFTTWNEKHQKYIPTVPIELSKGFQKKRIDHRHHALDALIIACATRDHVNLLNNKHAKSKNERYDLQHKLRHTEKWMDKDGKPRDKFTEFKKPWDNFTIDAKNELNKIVISFKQNLRVINKATNYYEKIVDGKKVKVKQEGVNWAIRKPMHEETVSGLVNLPWVKLGKDEIITATRERNDLVSIFNGLNSKEKIENRIKKITDTGIQKILFNYLKSRENDLDTAFSAEGIEEMNKNILKFNDGKFHQPIMKVRTYEKGKGRFVLGNSRNKKSKYVQGSPNLYFAIYQNNTGKRSFETIPLNIIIERQKQGLSSVPEQNENGDRLCPVCPFLNPNDLVYMPTIEEFENISSVDFNNLTKEQLSRIFFVNDFSGLTCYFRPNYIATAIAPKEVDMKLDMNKNKTTGSFDLKTASLDGQSIKEFCIKLKVDRLGNISKA